MSAFKPFSEARVEDGQIDRLFRIESGKGVVIASGFFQSREIANRFAECWNALRKIAFPQAHVDATEDYVQRLERLRREAVAASSGQAGWNHDMSQAPRDGSLVLLAVENGTVIRSYWCKPRFDPEHWCMLSHKNQPVAWMPWPEHPFVSRAKAEEEVADKGAAASDDPVSRGGTVRDRQHVPPSGFTGERRPGGEAVAAATVRESISQATAAETMGGTGDDCSFGNRGAWPPQSGASSSRGNDSLSVVTAGETAPFILHHHIFLNDVGSGA